MTTTADQTAINYGRQRGIVAKPAAEFTPRSTVTVTQLLLIGRQIGAPVTTKMKRDDLIRVVNEQNRKNGQAVDTSKLTARQRRRLRKRGAVA